jgi:hypothetical protein
MGTTGDGPPPGSTACWMLYTRPRPFRKNYVLLPLGALLLEAVYRLRNLLLIVLRSLGGFDDWVDEILYRTVSVTKLYAVSQDFSYGMEPAIGGEVCRVSSSPCSRK